MFVLNGIEHAVGERDKLAAERRALSCDGRNVARFGHLHHFGTNIFNVVFRFFLAAVEFFFAVAQIFFQNFAPHAVELGFQFAVLVLVGVVAVPVRRRGLNVLLRRAVGILRERYGQFIHKLAHAVELGFKPIDFLDSIRVGSRRGRDVHCARRIDRLRLHLRFRRGFLGLELRLLRRVLRL